MLRCVSLRVLAASCSLPPSGGRPRAAARCAALRRGRGLFAVLRPLRRPRVPFRGGALPPAPLPPVVRCALLALGLLRFAPAAVALGLRGLASLLPPPGLRPPRCRCGRCAACSLPCSAARRRLRRRRRAPVRGRRGAPQRPFFPRLSALGGFAASFPLRVARRLSPPCGFGSGRPRRASAPLRRLAAVGRPRGGFWRPLRRPPFVALCAPPRGVWGLRRCGGAKAARPFCAFGAFVVQGENWMQGATASATYCADCSLDIPYTGEFGKTRIILPNYLWISSIDTAPHFWYAHIRNRGGRYGLYGCAAGAARFFDLS